MYRKTQFGWVIFWSIMPLVAFTCVMVIKNKEEMQGMILASVLLLLFALLLFKDLTVSVDDSTISIKFGAGLIKKNILLNEIESCKQIRNKWYLGWGIRLGRGFTLYNVSGFDAIEITFKDGRRKIRIGTGDPEGLLEAINSKIKTCIEPVEI